ncbi:MULTISPECIES: tryptophan synthase subunit alpha [unclassified Synechocystis]|uniref:tryptophan synthase subunit alpha n=1 Tax=unclassified Synechocystis TaxID=2640012 RepID=UPI00041222BA|nr:MULTISPECIES: tryptophan synthase subunit alpha [unclassified Synechocystis]AIE74467.1 Tryptophan synthase alpha chain [Synechocystis sp. PCC 6714]MCT0254770.1 tryptophan synthase subunit alpha [Synechocystis sp. CS-94]
MNAVAACFTALRQRGQCALIPFLTAGDPDLATTAEALRILDRAGADLIELGVPYSDPLADGPVIQAAATRALQKGVKLDDVLAIVREVHQDIAAPIILFTYYNPIFYQGVDVFLDKIKAAGVKGLVVPDLPLEESDRLLEATAERGLELILLVAPTSSPERQTAIAKKSQGFVYLVSVTGVTGARTEVGARVEELLAGMRQVTDKPIGVGFGISQPEQAQQVKAWGADAVIVGSAMVKRLAEGTPAQGLQALETFCRELKAAIS